MILRVICVFLICFNASAAPKKTFTFRVISEPQTLDWNLAHTSVETHILMNLMEGLVTYDSSSRVVPGLAQSWKVSKDGRIYTFSLRKNVRWSDGVVLTAKDFAYSWKRLLSPTTAASYAYLLFDVEGAQEFNRGQLTDFSKVGIKAIDDWTLEVRLKQPVAHWIQIPGFWVTFPLRQDVVEKEGSAWARPGRMVTLGPFMLSSHDLDSQIVMKANPYYYDKRSNIDELVALIVSDNSAALNLYESGKLDFLIDLPALDLKRLAGRKDLITFPYLKVVYLGFNVKKYPLSLREVRAAIAKSIDRTQFDSLLFGGQKAATTFVPPPLSAYSQRIGMKHQPSQAKDEVRSAGIKKGQALSLELLVTNWDNPLVVAQFIQNQLKKNLGADVTIQAYDHKTFRAQLELSAQTAWILSWGADYPDPDNFLSLFLGHSGNNHSNWANAEYDRLILKARTSMNAKERTDLYLKAQKILLEDEVVTVPLYYEPNKALVKPWVKGLELNPMNYLYLKKVTLDSR